MNDSSSALPLSEWREIFGREDLSGYVKCLGMAISYEVGRRGNPAWIRNRDLVAATRLSHDDVERGLAVLCIEGWLQRVAKRARGRNSGATLYELVQPEEA